MLRVLRTSGEFNHVGPGRSGSKTLDLPITRTKTVNNSSVGRKNSPTPSSLKRRVSLGITRTDGISQPKYRDPSFLWIHVFRSRSDVKSTSGAQLDPRSLTELFLLTLPRVLCSSGLSRSCLAVRRPESGGFNELRPASNVGVFRLLR